MKVQNFTKSMKLCNMSVSENRVTVQSNSVYVKHG